MKKHSILYILCFFIFFQLNAQITITEADMPAVGVVQATIDVNITPGISIGNSGANQTWDFSDFEGIDTTISEYVSPVGTPGESSFPTATVASVFEGGYAYLEINSNEALFLGSSADTSSNNSGQYFDLVFDPSETVFQLPTTYLTSFEDESGFSITSAGPGMGLDSIRISISRIKQSTIDGWGTIITPNGSFNGLREESILNSFDTTEIYAFGQWQVFMTDMNIDTIYYWYSKDSKGPLVSIDIENGTILSVDYQDIMPTINTPVASFSYVDQGQGAVDFTDESQNQPTSWEWDFGDGNSSIMQNPSHTYTMPGTYTVCLTATNSSGSDTNCQMLDIEIASIPVADFSFSTPDQLTIDFTDLSQNQPTSWEWDFGDGNSSTMQNPSHTYAVQATYTVCLTASNIAGENTVCKEVNIAIAPVAAFSYADQGQGVVDFMDESTFQPTSWEWDFGDGETSTMQNPTHTYTMPGTYTVCLTATNSSGSDTNCQTLEIMITSINIVDNELSLEIFPNPVTDWLNLQLQNNSTERLNFILFNEMGQRVLNERVSGSGNFVFNVKSYAPGVYFFQLQTLKGELKASGKLLKK